MAAKKIKSSSKIGTIVALDPAAGYSFSEDKKRVAHTDADYVEVIHTDITQYGMAEQIGHGNLTLIKTPTHNQIENIIFLFQPISTRIEDTRSQDARDFSQQMLVMCTLIYVENILRFIYLC